jgi:hypothetical protein
VIEPPSPRLLKEAVSRGGYKCSICGAPCRDHEARRHTEPGPFGDSSLNFAPLCAACTTWLDGKAPPPARYLVHIHDAARLRRVLRKIIGYGAIGITLAAFGAFASLAGWIIYTTPHTIWNAFGTALLLVLLLSMGGTLVSGLLGRTRAPSQTIHHTFDEQRVHVREGG